MKSKIDMFIILLSIGLTSCNTQEYILVEKDDVQFAFIANSFSTFKGYFYHGSDDAFHYFQSDWDFGEDKSFKLNKEDLTVVAPFSKDDHELQITLEGQDSLPDFGFNEYYQLFILEE